ncbi:hypothetical protein ACIBFB_02240 [Nocardiopsis sp. NPDC050513]|uniref:hypothetical protein n=1 Tax=Nocardiopsis sp. NPDC050513 TaxID=3364338 RepID=UPI0037A65391
MSFSDHMRRAAEHALSAVPSDVYLVGMRIEGVDQDPRRPYLALGYNTESHYRSEMRRQSSPDPLEVRWLYAHWMLDVEREAFIGHPEADPEGAALLLRDAERLGLRYGVPDDEVSDNAGAEEERLTAHFDGLCVDLARHLHRSGRLAEILGRPTPVILYDMFRGDAEIALSTAANPPELLTGFLSFYEGAGAVSRAGGPTPVPATHRTGIVRWG